MSFPSENNQSMNNKSMNSQSISGQPTKSPIQIIMIDNYDSFTYNLVNQFRSLNAEVIVFRNNTPVDEIFTAERLANKQTVVVISPGPGTPQNAGNSMEIIKQYAGKLPILGICLGHQAIVESFGGKVGHAQQVVHGKADTITTIQHKVFEQLPNPLTAARYHSLAATELPHDLTAIAYSGDEVMAVQHQSHRIISYQFHPESILTTFGDKLLRASLSWLTTND